MLFTIIVIVAVVAVALYVAKKTKTKTKTTTLHAEETIIVPSIHEEIAKTVEEAKTHTPIVDEVETPTMDAKPKKKPQPKKKLATKVDA
jgi:outer membrane biosynthesis protein TonB